jgi:BNR repeat protein
MRRMILSLCSLVSLLILSVPLIHLTQADSPGVIFTSETRLSGGSPQELSQNEPAIAVNPLNPDNIVAVFQAPSPNGFRSCFFSFSFDGGRHWTFGGSAPRERNDEFCADPGITADAAGNFYFTSLDGDLDPFGIVLDFDVVVAKSTDGGRTFPSFSVAVNRVPGENNTPFPDKDLIAADTSPTSPFQGSVYVAFSTLSSHGDVEINVVISRDGGTSWSAPIAVTDTQGNKKPDVERFGAVPLVAGDGTVYVFYMAFPLTPPRAGPTSIQFSKSSDGGATWAPPASVASNLPSPGFFLLRNADPDFGILPGHGFKSNSMPAAAIAADGTLSVAWIDFTAGFCIPFSDPNSSIEPACTNSDVRLSVSRNGGSTWTSPVKVSDETNATDQFFPWIATHPDGKLSLIWMDKRLDPNNVNYDAFYTRTADGSSFLPNVRISTQTSLTGTLTFLGDYNGVAATADSVIPIWGDARSGNVDVFVARGLLLP